MKRNKSILIFILGIVFTSLLLNSCKSETPEEAKNLSINNDFKTITRTSDLERYEIKVPKYMEPTEILNPEANFQFLHLYKEEYIIIINESKRNFKEVISEYNEFKNHKSLLDKYSSFQTQFLKQKMNIIHQSKFQKATINTLNSQSLELLVKLEKIDENIAYFITYLEGKESLYFIMAWTLESKRKVFKEKYKKIIHSFKIN